jgi:hypothetical protein
MAPRKVRPTVLVTDLLVVGGALGLGHHLFVAEVCPELEQLEVGVSQERSVAVPRR